MDLFQQGLHEEALERFKKAANLRHSEATFNVALMYYRGNGIPQDKAKAFEFYEKASKLGNLGARCNMAYMCYMADGVAENKELALKLYEEAERAGHSAALYSLGSIFFDKPSAKDQAKALTYLERFIETGYSQDRPKALYMIGHIHQTGSIDSYHKPQLALEFYRRGAALEDPSCIAGLTSLKI